MEKMYKRLSYIILFVITLISVFFVKAQTNDTIPYIDPRILEEFNKTSEVKIIVEVRDTSGITITSRDSQEEQAIKDAKKKEILGNKTNSVLSTLPEVDFKLSGKFLLGNGFYGRITKTGFDILINNSDVAGIYLDRAIHTTPAPIVIVDKNESKKESELKVVKNDTLLKNISIEKEQKSGVPELQKSIQQEGKSLLSFLITLFIIIIIMGSIYLIIKFRKK